jgi:prepilin-type N-terminal cleavage/methylation domain-containing protein
MRRSRSHGFTLIEITIVVAIIGILASIAIPGFRSMQYRARAAERPVIMDAIYKSIDEIRVREGKFPTDTGDGTTFLNLLSENPDDSVSNQRRPWRIAPDGASDNWPALQMTVDGAVYYRYGGYASQDGNTLVYHLYAFGDLDGDGVANRWEKTWRWVNGVKEQDAGSTLECGDCTLAIERNPGTF